MMSDDLLARLLLAAGLGHFCILAASSLVPLRLDWRRELAGLSRLHRQMYWVYGGYVVLAIVAIGLLTIFNPRELAAGGSLARGFCGYVAIFWGVRLALQAVFDVEPYLTAWWLRLGYHGLTAMFVFFTAVYGWAALRPV